MIDVTSSETTKRRTETTTTGYNKLLDSGRNTLQRCFVSVAAINTGRKKSDAGDQGDFFKTTSCILCGGM
jgi:hypothetical protein